MLSKINKLLQDSEKNKKILFGDNQIGNDDEVNDVNIKNVRESFMRRKKSIVAQILSRATRQNTAKSDTKIDREGGGNAGD